MKKALFLLLTLLPVSYFALEPCNPKIINLAESGAKTDDEKAMISTLLSYQEAYCNKNLSELRFLVATDRVNDTAPHRIFGYGTLYNWKRVRLYTTKVISIESAYNRITVEENLEALSDMGILYLYKGIVAYTLTHNDSLWKISARIPTNVIPAESSLPEEILSMAQSALYENRFSDAVPLFERYLKFKPGDYYSLCMMGGLKLTLGDLKASREYFNKALRLPSNQRRICSLLDSTFFDSQVYATLGVLEHKEGNLAMAKADLEHAVSLNNDNAAAYNEIAYIMEDKNDFNERNRYLRKSYSISSVFAPIERAIFGKEAVDDNIRGLKFLNNEKVSEARVNFMDAISKSAYFDKPYNNLGLCYLKEKKYKEAKENFEKAISLNPKNLWAYMNLAYAYYESGDIQMGDEIRKKALKIDPEFGPILYLTPPPVEGGKK